MAKRVSRSALILVGMALIGGCQSIGGIHFSNRIELDRTTAERNKTLFTQQGAALLRAGNIGQAVEAYNLALATGEEPAPAYNGLGVAYARLGRPDLAYRFFKKATMGAPEDLVFARNLARLMDSPQFAAEMAKRSERNKAVEQAAVLPSVQSASAQPVVHQRGRLYRDSNRQVSLITSPAPVVRVATEAERNSGPCARMAKARNASQCGKVTLPQTASRLGKPEELAMNRADPQAKTAPQPAEAAGVGDGQGQRKVIEMPKAARQPGRTDGPGQTAS
jgi:tetratricopeptide (TPR) repeat protein